MWHVVLICGGRELLKQVRKRPMVFTPLACCVTVPAIHVVSTVLFAWLDNVLTVDSFFGLCGRALFLAFNWWTWIYFIYILVQLRARYRVSCTNHVKGERSCLYACTCLVKGEIFDCQFVFSALVLYVTGVNVCPHCNSPFHKCTWGFM
jgi:hypothetical protein